MNPNRRYVRKAEITFFVVALIAIFAARALPAGGGDARKMLVIVADNVSMDNWKADGLSHLREAERRGALGLMVTRTVTHGSETASHVTLGAGLRGEDHPDGGLAFDADEDFNGRRASWVYSLRTGAPAASANVLHLGAGPVRATNHATKWVARPGALGTLLREHGLRTAVVGNSDFSGNHRRFSVLIAMDERGAVDDGDVSGAMLSRDDSSPWGESLNFSNFSKSIIAALGTSDFIVADYGETARAGQFALAATPEGHAIAVLKAMSGLDNLIAFILERVDLDATQVIVLSPTPGAAALSRKETLTPILVFGAGVERTGRGLLSSRSTQRAGLVMNVDFAVHVCDFFGVSPAPDFTGGPFISKPNPAPLPFLVKLHDRDSFVENRSGMLRNIVIWHLVMMVLCFVVAVNVRHASRATRRLLSALIMITGFAFISFLFMAGFPSLNEPLIFSAAYFGVCLLLALTAASFPRPEYQMAFISGVIFMSLAVDQIAGAGLIRNCVLGYYPQVGARFYGIGNEYVGFMISAPIVTLGLLLDVKKEFRKTLRIIALLLLPAVVFIVGSPRLGANFGGLVSCSMATICMLLLIFDFKLNFKTLLVIIVSAALVVGVFVGTDAFLLGGKSHVGRLFAGIIQGDGLDELIRIASRKISVNMRLIVVSFWSALFLIALGISLAANYLPIDELKRVLNKHKYFQHAYVASILGALTAFLVNDSGIVPAATALIMPTGAFFLLLFNQPGMEFTHAKNVVRGKPSPQSDSNSADRDKKRASAKKRTSAKRNKSTSDANHSTADANKNRRRRNGSPQRNKQKTGDKRNQENRSRPRKKNGEQNAASSANAGRKRPRQRNKPTGESATHNKTGNKPKRNTQGKPRAGTKNGQEKPRNGTPPKRRRRPRKKAETGGTPINSVKKESKRKPESKEKPGGNQEKEKP